jgi:myo-inositol-1-phosphate synthase
VFIASDPEWAKKFEDAGVPIVGDDIKSQVGATITHRVMAKLFEDRGVVLDRTYQLNVGGNMDFKNMLERERLESKKVSKTQAVTSNLRVRWPARSRTRTSTSARRTTSPGSTTASGRTCASRVAPSATCRSTSSTSSRCGTPRTAPASSSTPSARRRSPRTAASAARCCPRRSYFMKSPPVQREDTLGREMLEAFISGAEER